MAVVNSADCSSISDTADASDMDIPLFSLDALAESDERVPCVTNLEAPGLGFLDPSSGSEDLAADSKVRGEGEG